MCKVTTCQRARDASAHDTHVGYALRIVRLGDVALSSTSEKHQQLNPVFSSGQVSRLFDRVLGYDFFISYAHADAPGYAEQLDNQLVGLGFKAFLDKHQYVAGDDLNEATLRRVRASSKLVVIVGPNALNSHWVLQEVEAAIQAERPIIAIDLIGDLSNQEKHSRLAELLRDRIHIREPGGLEAAQADKQTLEAITRSFQATRREALRFRLALAAMLFFAVLAGYSYWQKNLADDRAEQYLAFCNRVVDMVNAGNKKIDSLRISEFGKLIADVTDTLAQMPDPGTDPDLRCIPAGVE
ncbi:MAG: toll/interleukin-1 receptor domain-containing protein [Sedimenticolaceae bacterium]